MHTVLLIDDDIEVLNLNAKYLKNCGYHVITAENFQKGKAAIIEKKPDCIILDVMMPVVNGFYACQEFRKQIDVPIIFLTGLVSEENKIKGLLLGADDYMVKPYSLKELSTRILVNIRRYEALSHKISQLVFGTLSIQPEVHKAYYEKEEIPLSNREYELLLYLAKNAGRILTFDQIGEHVWGCYREEDRRVIMVNTSRLRKKLGGYPGLENIIETVWSQGYKFVARG